MVTVRIGVRIMKIHLEEDEFRYCEFTHVKALDTAGRDTAFTLGFWNMHGLDL